MADYPSPERADVERVRPGPTPCPDCACCTAALCEKAKADPWEGLRDCFIHCARGDLAIVKDCPCAPINRDHNETEEAR